MSFDFVALETFTIGSGKDLEALAMALEEMATVMLTGGECSSCGALGSHDQNPEDPNEWQCRECHRVFSFEIV